MYISYNNISNPQDMLTFTDIPNILKLSESVVGTNAQIVFTFSGNLRQTVTADSQYYVTVFGESVSNVMTPINAQNKRFFIASDNSSTAASFARALRNCGGIAADFNIIHSGASVTLTAKVVGSKLGADYLQRNIGNDYLTVSAVEGSTSSNVMGSQISVDVSNGGQYVTTLTKNWYGDEAAFDVSPVLSTFSEYGTTKDYELSISMIGGDGTYESLGSVSGNTTFGYKANLSEDFIYIDGENLLLNAHRGSVTQELYVYGNTIPLSILCDSSVVNASVTLSIKDSAFNEIYSGTSTFRKQLFDAIVDGEVVIPDSAYSQAFYADITVGDNTYRFNVIKPLKMAEGYQRVCWRNEYGGISFFDFTGQRSESDNLDIETYEKSIFDYYEITDGFELKKIYDNQRTKTVTLNSHLMQENGRWIFNSLAKSKLVWTYIEGDKKYIIPKSISVTEDNSYNGIYTAQFQFTYSNDNE